MNKKTFTIKPIGTFFRVCGKSWISLHRDYAKGMKNIDSFLYIKIFWYSEPSNSIYCGSNIEFGTVKILSVDFRNSTIYLDDFPLNSGAGIFDIKAYIPAEDRVKNFKVPEFYGEEKDWYEPSSKFIKEGYLGVEGEAVEIHPAGFIESKGKGTKILFHNYDGDFTESFEGFSHINILWYLHRFDKGYFRKTLVSKPPYEAPELGVFTSRSPVRPNPIALTAAEIEEIGKDYISISGIDAYDKTPVIGVRPYIPSLDRVKDFESPEWMAHWPQWLKREKEEEVEGFETKPSDIELLSRLLGVDSSLKEIRRGGMKEVDNEPEKGGNIKLTGARQNNLENIDLEIKKNSFTVITGVSGSGKSSIAFDTLFAEGQRRYLSSVSTGSMSGLIEKPDFDNIYNLPPVVAVNQKAAGVNIRSTVGSMSDLHFFEASFCQSW